MHELWSELLQSGHMIPLPRAQELVNVIYKEHCIDPSLDFHKRFFHEICPLVSIASHISDEVSGIIVSARSANYDGVIVLADERHQIVELTAAVDGHEESLRMELLRRRGSAPVYQKIEFSGTKRQRIFGPNEAEAIRTDLRDNEILQNMERCLRKEQQRAGGNQFYRGAWLGIVFDEWPPGHDQDRWDALSTRLVEAKSFEPFKRLFCVGMHRSYVFDSKRLASSQSGLS